MTIRIIVIRKANMHVLLGILGTTVTLLILLKQLNAAGFDPSSLNPFLWYRRHRWYQQFSTKNIHRLTQPLEVAALLLVATAKCEGEMSAEQKQCILGIFETEFHLAQREASDLMVLSVFLLKDEQKITEEIPKILEPSRAYFAEEQRYSTVALMEKVADVEGSPRQRQKDLIEIVEAEFSKQSKPQSKW